MKDLVIVGHGGLAREVTFLIEEINNHQPAWNLLGYIAAQRESVGQKHGKYSVQGDDAWLAASKKSLAVVLAIGNPHTLPVVRERIQTNRHLYFPNLLHPQVTGDWANIKMAEGNLILNGAAFTTNIRVGCFNIFNPGCTVAHDCTLGNYNFIAPGVHIAGEAVIGNRVFLGMASAVLPKINICDDVLLGAGSVVVESITEPGTYAGVPARRL